MNKRELKRNRIFQVYTEHLKLLIKNGLLEGKSDKYICPICTEIFDLNKTENPLTLEDAPPKSLGGKANILTCKSCNNTCGTKIDSHLSERLRELDTSKFLKGTSSKVIVNINGEQFRSTLNVDEKGVMTIEHNVKNNHPVKLKEHIPTLKGGQVIDMNFLKTKVIPENLQIALLKTAYILAFEKFGYNLMLHDCYDIVREQILNPDKKLYPKAFWSQQPFAKDLCGVYISIDKGLESIVTIFRVSTSKSVRTFTVFLPLPIIPIEKALQNLKNQFDDNGQLALSLFPKGGTSVDYINDIDNILALREWIQKRSDLIKPKS